MSKTRISKKVLGQFPTKIADRIQAIRKQYRVASFSYYECLEGETFYFDEGAKVWAFYGEEERHLKMVSANTVGSNDCYQIGTTAPFKAGTTILEVGYLGKYYLNIYNFGEKEFDINHGEKCHTFEMSENALVADIEPINYTVDPKTNQLELFQTEDRQLTLF